MGIPRVLDMALCDLNLGLPDEHKVFVIDHQKSKLPFKISEKGECIPYSDIKTYHNIASINWLQKISSNNKSPQYSQYSIKNWKMYLDNHRKRIIVTFNNSIYAFSEYGKVYIIENGIPKCVKEKRSINELFSEMLKFYSNTKNWIIEQSSVTPPKTINGLIEIDII